MLTADLARCFTAIAGAIAGANLTLILFDLSRAQSVGERLARKPAVATTAP